MSISVVLRSLAARWLGRVRGSQLAFLWRHFRNDPLHEAVEERHREGGVAVRRAVDHAFCDERVSCWRGSRHFLPEKIRDLAGAMRTWPQFGHRAHVTFLRGCQAIEPYAKETCVEFVDRFLVRELRVRKIDRRPLGDVPAVLAPFLQEVRVAVGPTKDFRYCVGVERSSFPLSWHAKRG